jgi:hypothetical protein
MVDNAYWIANITSDISTDHRLYSEVTLATIGRYITTSCIGVVGGSGAAATV